MLCKLLVGCCFNYGSLPQTVFLIFSKMKAGLSKSCTYSYIQIRICTEMKSV